MFLNSLWRRNQVHILLGPMSKSQMFGQGYLYVLGAGSSETHSSLDQPFLDVMSLENEAPSQPNASCDFFLSVLIHRKCVFECRGLDEPRDGSALR